MLERVQQFQQIQSLLSSPLNTQIIIESKMEKQYITKSTREKDDKQNQAKRLGQELEYMDPKKHRYFCKIYKLESSINEINLLVADMQDYHSLISSQSKKIVKFIHEHHLNNTFNSLLISALQFANQLAIQNSRFISKIVHINSPTTNTCPRDQSNYCLECKATISNYRVKQIKQELQLNKFEDKCNFYNVDYINYADLNHLRRESNHIIDSQLGLVDNNMEIKGTCLSLQQYDEVLNLLGSDLHQKNSEIQKIIHYFNEADRKFIEEGSFRQRQSEQEMKNMQKMAEESTITNRLNTIIHLFFGRYNKAKQRKRREMQVQVNIKDNEVIKELEKEKKAMKGRIYQLTADKQRITADYQSKIRLLQMEISSNTKEFQQKMGEMSIQYAELSKKYAQQFNLHEIHKKQLQNVTNQYTTLLATLNRRSSNVNSREKLSTSKKSRGESHKKSRVKGKIKNSIKKLPSNYSDINDQEDSDDIEDSSKQSTKNGLRSMADSRKATLIQNSQRDGSKFATCEKIEEKHEQEQGDSITKLIVKKQVSRFKALINQLSSNSNIQNEEKDKLEKVTVNSASLQVIKDKKGSQQGKVLPEIRILGENSVKSGTEQRNDILYKLFQTERQSRQLKIKFPNFLQLYNNFIISICSQKLIARSSSVSHSQTQQHFRQRVSILNQKHSSKHLQSSINYLKPFEKSTSALSHNEDRSEGVKNRVESTKKSLKEERPRLQLLNKKSQYYFKKGSQKSLYDFNYSKTAENTLRDNTILSNTRQTELFKCSLFTKEQIIQLFLNEANMTGNTIVNEPISKDQNQNLMSIYTQLANINLYNKHHYCQIKSILSFPKQIINKQPINNSENTTQIKNALRHILFLHRGCRRQKGKNCIHLSKFMEKIRLIGKQE